MDEAEINNRMQTWVERGGILKKEQLSKLCSAALVISQILKNPEN